MLKKYNKSKLPIQLLVCKIISDDTSEKTSISKLTYTDWEKVYRFISTYNLAPLLYYKLNKYNLTNLLPFNILQKLKTVYNNNQCITLQRQYETKKILNIFRQNNIDIILLKGIHISEQYYETPFARPMSDIDILAQKADLDKIRTLLQEFGCIIKEEQNELVSQIYLKHIPPIITPKKNILEVHWKLVSNFHNSLRVNLDIKELWKNRVEYSYFNAKCFILKPEHLLLHLCIHIATDLFKQKILQLYDIFLVINKSDIDWDLLLDNAYQWNCTKGLYCVLLIVKHIFNAQQIPKYILDILKKSLDCPQDLDRLILEETLKDLLTINDRERIIAAYFDGKNTANSMKSIFNTFFDKKKIMFIYRKKKWNNHLFFIRAKDLFYQYFKLFFKLHFTNQYKKKRIVLDDKKRTMYIQKWFEH